MKVEFIKDYIGRETAMQQRHTGDIVDMPFSQASALITLDVVKEIEGDAPTDYSVPLEEAEKFYSEETITPVVKRRKRGEE